MTKGDEGNRGQNLTDVEDKEERPDSMNRVHGNFKDMNIHQRKKCIFRLKFT